MSAANAKYGGGPLVGPAVDEPEGGAAENGEAENGENENGED
jgi:hypothetical protein